MEPTNRQSSWRDGVIVTDAGELIARPGMTLTELLSSPVGNCATIEGFPPERPWATFDPVSIGGFDSAAGLIFHGDRLARITIVVSQKTGDRFGFATGFSAQNPRAEVRFLESWVEREIGKKPPAVFAWGDIAASYDDRGGFSSIKFIYR